MLVQIKPVKKRIPASLRQRCEEPYLRSQMRTAGDALARGDENEAKLIRCSAKVDRIIEWDAGP